MILCLTLIQSLNFVQTKIEACLLPNERNIHTFTSYFGFGAFGLFSHSFGPEIVDHLNMDVRFVICVAIAMVICANIACAKSKTPEVFVKFSVKPILNKNNKMKLKFSKHISINANKFCSYILYINWPINIYIIIESFYNVNGSSPHFESQNAKSRPIEAPLGPSHRYIRANNYHDNKSGASRPAESVQRPQTYHNSNKHQNYKSGTSRTTGPVFTIVKTDPRANFRWGVRHFVGKKYA